MKQRTDRDKQAEDGTLWFGQPVQALPPLDAEDAQDALADLVSAAREQGASQLASLCSSKSPPTDFLGSVLSLSPFLKSAFLRRPIALEALFSLPLAKRLEAIEADILAPVDGETESQLMTRLRRLKGEAHALIGLADLSRTQDTQVTIHQLSSLADACLGAAVRFLLRDAHNSGKLKLPNLNEPEEGSGWILLGMGKLGARELNFSSDIDLIVLFDPAAPAIPNRDEAGELFVRLTRRLVRILHDRTGDGYVFRTDLRLRPDPGSTPLAISVDAALAYYEARGQNWERAAMIKARPVAGDGPAGARFLGELRPYV